jgi:hypothetical protein
MDLTDDMKLALAEQ